ncbi:hypothetical protein [Lacticaseibacillus daqingensis]|uniref:hypothetical protein n=1 Tax=Lacticaseibacillus daqingensis TaxID=2486014 RepID=UPI000F77F768|nr:hypothetical protein [Lacticaseibacillus daqingensis]
MSRNQVGLAALGLSAIVAGGLALGTQLPAAQPLAGTEETPISTGAARLMTRTATIQDLARRANLTPAEAALRLFPQAAPGHAGARYVVLKAPITTLAADQQGPADAGYVYWYAEASAGGAFHGIKNIRYAGYHPGQLALNARLDYALIDANRLHYTIAGHGFTGEAQPVAYNTQVVGLDQVGWQNFNVDEWAAYAGQVFQDADYTW